MGMEEPFAVLGTSHQDADPNSQRPWYGSPDPTEPPTPHPSAHAVVGAGCDIVHPVPGALSVLVQVSLALKAKAWWSRLPK